MKKHIPNFFTLCNAACGFLGLVAVLYFSKVEYAALFMIGGLVFDFLDGMVARLLKVSGELGKQLDSLADAITFGALPGAMVFDMLCASEWALAAAFIPVFSVLRLGKFNLDTRQVEGFIGLATPAHSIFWLGLVLHFWWEMKMEYANTLTQVNEASERLAEALTTGNAAGIQLTSTSFTQTADAGPFWAVIILVMSLLMVSNIRMFSFKMKSLGWKGNEVRYTFLLLAAIASVVCIFLWQKPFLSLSVIILLYILISIINNLVSKKHEVQS